MSEARRDRQGRVRCAALLLVCCVATLLVASAGPVAAQAPLWATLPDTPQLPASVKQARVEVNGVSLFYTDSVRNPQKRRPVILLHGGLANSDYWGNQVRALLPAHRVLTVDSRGHGRSTRNGQPYSYDRMADDLIGLMDILHIRQADLVGWSDGAIVSLDVAIRYPSRVGRIFAYAANSDPSGLVPDGDKSPNFARFVQRAGGEYRGLSATPDQYDAFVEQIGHMWASEPHWTAQQLAAIHATVWVVDGDHDEVIRREHTEYLARSIPGAALLILPNTSHFAFLQDPALFNAALLDFLDRASDATR